MIMNSLSLRGAEYVSGHRGHPRDLRDRSIQDGATRKWRCLGTGTQKQEMLAFKWKEKKIFEINPKKVY